PITALRPDLPAGLVDILQRATAKAPGERYPDVESMVADFHSVLPSGGGYLPRVGPTAAADREIRNPYRGLRPFQEADANDFFGRQALTETLLRRWTPSPSPAGAEHRWRGAARGGSRFLAVVG